MGYSNYKTLKSVTQKFGLSAKRDRFLTNISPIEPSLWLLESLRLSELLPLTNEKSKSERVVSPILTEVAQHFIDKVTFFSGENLTVNPDDNLSGECDFFFTLVPKSPYLESPIISIVEAKDEDMEWGIAQCAAQLYGAKLFNEVEGKNIPVMYGCASTGTDWQFLRFENNTFLLDSKIYTNLKEILGVWHHILRFYTQK